MELSFSTTTWKNSLLGVHMLLSTVNIWFLSCGVVIWGGALNTTGSLIVVALGSMIFMISFLGCWISLQEARSLAMKCAHITTAAVALQIIYMFFFVIKKDGIMDDVVLRVKQAWLNEPGFKDSMTNIEIKYNCCGKSGPHDYIHKPNDVIPNSCCYNKNCTQLEHIYSRGCIIGIVRFIDDESATFIWLNVLIIAVELLAVICSHYLAKDLQKHESEPKTAKEISLDFA